MCHIFPVSPPAGGCSGCFCISALVNDAVKNTGRPEVVVLFVSSKFLEVNLLVYGICIFMFLRIVCAVSIVPAHIYIPTNSA